MAETGGCRVLVADDDPTIRALLVEALRDEVNGEIRAARDGLDALARMERWRPDVAVIDVMMPRLDGLELVARMQADASLRDVPVIAISAVANQERVLASGCCEFLAKPFDLDQLIDTVRRLIAQTQG